MWTEATSMGGKLNSIFVRSKLEVSQGIRLFRTEQSHLMQ